MRFLDFSSSGSYWIALLPEVILSLAAIVILMRAAFARGAGGDGGSGAGGADDAATPSRGGGSGATVAGAAGVAPEYRRMSADCLVALYSIAGALVASLWLSDATGPPDAMIALDGFRVASNVILLGGGLLIVALSQDYLRRERFRAPEFHALTLLALAGMLVLVSARDLILLFVGLELMSISVYVLTGFARRNPRSSEASLKYFIVGAFASAFIVYGIALLYGAAGTTRLGAAASRIADMPPGGDFLLIAGVGLLLIGFGFKIAAVPFHMWAPDAYEGAPTPVTSLMAAGVKAAAFIALLRVLTVDLGAVSGMWGEAVWWMAMLTMIAPNIIALSQRSVKRMLAYSSVAHAGYLLVGVVASSALGRAGSLFYLAAYTVATAGSFAIVFHVAGRGDRNELADDYRGLGWRRPAVGAALVVFLLSLAGFPPTAGFVGKLYLLRAAVDEGQTSLAITLVASSLVAYYYYLRVVWKMYFDAPKADMPVPARATPGFSFVTGICVALVLLAGLFPGRIIDRARSAVVGPGAEAAVQASPSLPPPEQSPAIER